MKGVELVFFSYELHKHKGKLMHEWLLEFAKKHDVPGGCVFRGIAGYGRHGILHEEHFFELASNVPIEIVFLLSEEGAKALLALLDKEGIELFYSKSAIEYGSTNKKK